MSGLLDVVTISGGNIAGHLSLSHTTNQSSQSLTTFRLPVPSHGTSSYLLPLSVLNATPVTLCLFPSSTAGRLALMMAHGEPHHASSCSALISAIEDMQHCSTVSRKGNTDQVGICSMSLSWQVKAGCIGSH